MNSSTTPSTPEEILAAVREHGSLRKAARAHGLGESTLSTRLTRVGGRVTTLSRNPQRKVPTSILEPILSSWLAKEDADRPHRRSINGQIHGGAQESLAALVSRVSGSTREAVLRRLYSILKQTVANVSFSTADAFITALDPSLWYTVPELAAYYSDDPPPPAEPNEAQLAAREAENAKKREQRAAA